MARPNKQGLDYFPLDVDFLENEKMLAISGEFAVKGEIITLRLLCEIYRNGYFVEYSGLLKNKLARLGGLSGGLVEEVVKKLVEYNFFNGEVFREHNVLTSKGIQKRYLEAVKRRKNVDFSQYWLLKNINVNINNSSSDVNVNINSQSKVKESKVKKEKNNNGDAIDFSELLNFINEKTGRKFRVMNDGVKRKYRARLKDGYTKSDIVNAVVNACESDYHKSENNRYLTPEFFSRAETLDKYGHDAVKQPKKKQDYGIWSV